MSKRRRQSIFDKHPDGARILQDIITGRIKKTEAAKILCCSPANITQYLQRHNIQMQPKTQSSPPKKPVDLTKLLPKKEKKKKKKEQADDPLNVLADETIDKTKDQLQLLSIESLKVLQNQLFEAFYSGGTNLTVNEYCKLNDSILKSFQMQLKYKLEETEKDAQVVRLDEQQVNELFGDFEEIMCNVCPYRNKFNEDTAKTQDKARLAPE